jgi:hypothetical protein
MGSLVGGLRYHAVSAAHFGTVGEESMRWAINCKSCANFLKLETETLDATSKM